MDGSLKERAGSLWAEQAVTASLDYTLGFLGLLDPGDTIASVAWTTDPGLDAQNPIWTSTTATVSISVAPSSRATAATNWFWVRCDATSAAGGVFSQAFRLYIHDRTTLGAGVLSCLPSIPNAVMSLRRDRLMVAARSYMPGIELDDDFLLEKLVAAEADVQRRLRVFLTPREMLPTGADPSEAAALVAAGSVVEYEPGYDYDPQMFVGNRWGLLETRQKPIIAIHSLMFAYPLPSNVLFTFPHDWIRGDFKYGRLNIVPIQAAAALPLNAFILSALGGGSTVPLMLQLRYRAGLANCAADYPEILDVIKKEAVVSVVEDSLSPVSASTSADGLSESISTNLEAYKTAAEKRIETLRQALHGVRMMVM